MLKTMSCSLLQPIVAMNYVICDTWPHRILPSFFELCIYHSYHLRIFCSTLVVGPSSLVTCQFSHFGLFQSRNEVSFFLSSFFLLFVWAYSFDRSSFTLLSYWIAGSFPLSGK